MLSLVLPTYNEAANLPELLPKLRETLKDLPHEIIVVDDNSPDRTWDVARTLSQDWTDVHVVRRMGRRGLSSAVIEGFLSSKGDVLAVMDADGQHDLELLPKLYAAAQQNDIVIGSRYTEGGDVGQWDERRHLMSKVATNLAINLCKVNVTDPMSGFFAVKRSVFEEVLPRLNPKGFKILLDFLVHVPRTVTVQELPFSFGERMHGESKLSRRVQVEFLEYLYDVTFGRYIPLTFIKYCIVGAIGAGVQVAAYYSFVNLFAVGERSLFGFSMGVLFAIEVAIVFNFILNNLWTFAHARLHGTKALVGFVKFNLACTFGALANYAVGAFLYSSNWSELSALIIGAITGAIWNYTMNRLFTWKSA